MEFCESSVVDRYEATLAEAEHRLSALEVAQGRRPKASGLAGWVFEQTIRFCLERELHLLGCHAAVREQQSLHGRAKVDLLVGKAAIELKSRGSFGLGDAKYVRYRRVAAHRGWTYLYLTMQERHLPYRDATLATFGCDNAFFLDALGDWSRFVERVRSLQL